MDRIDDAYNGLMGEEFMRKTRERLHWMCSKVAGEKILDVGCSQGTLARLLAPLGKSVLGVDINQDAISYAEGKLPELDVASRERLRFVAMNFMDFKSEERFDTIVMGEILEHLPDPAAFVKKACTHLVKGGTIVATVPFGINDDPDHRQTFYWSWIRDIVAPLFDIGDIEFFGKWIGVVGTRRERRATVENAVPLAVVKELEKAFFAIERPLVDDNKARGLKLKAQSQDLAEAQKGLDAKTAEAQTALTAETAQKARADKALADYAKLKTDLSSEIARQKDALAKVSADKDAELAKQKASIAKLTADKAAVDAAAAKQKTVLEGEVARQKTALAAEQAKIKDLNSKLAATRNELAATKNEALELRVNLDADRRISDGQAEQISVLKAALQFAANRPQVETNDTRLLEYSQEVRELRSALESKRDEAVERAERLGHLLGQVESLKAEKELLSSRVAELTATLAAERETVKSKDAEIAARDALVAEANDYAKLCEGENTKLAEDNKALVANVEALKAEKNAIAESLRASESENERKDAAIHRIASERTDFEQRVALLGESVKEKERELEAARREIKNGQSIAEGVQDELNEAKRRIEGLSGSLERSRDDAAQAKRVKAEVERRLARCEEDVKSLERQLDVQRRAMEMSKADLDVATKREEEEGNKFSQAVVQLKQANAKIAALDVQLAKAKAALSSEQKKTAEQAAALKQANDACAAEGRKLAATAVQMKERDAQIQSLRKENKSLSVANDKLGKRLHRAEHRYDILSKSKLGRLTLAYWRWKDGVKVKKAGDVAKFGSQRRVGGKQGTEGVGNKDAKTVALAVDDLPKGDEGFFDRISARIAGMPESNGSRYYEKLDSKIGIICDQFYWDSICSAADFKYISPSVTEDELSKLDCMLVVSTWTGLKNEEWRGISTEHRPMRIRAEEIIDICRKRKVPTIFYSKEDPPNYDLYVGLAQKCDFVFTSAAECIPDYKRDCGHDRVYAMKFCINPTVHNPVGMRYASKERNVIFSGSWMEKYPHRCKDLDTIFTGILQSGRELNIVDRNYALRGNPMYRYPEKYRRFQSPAIDHASLMKVHKLFDWAVNINTVKDSATMFANRVYELQASGNLLLSNYSVGVSNLLPTVFLVHESDEAARMLTNFTDEEVYERQVSGVRRVMSGETCYDRISEMLSLAGIRKEVSRRRVLVIVDKMSDKVRAMFDRQSYGDKEILEISQVTDQIYEDADMIAFFREDYEYGVFYLEDMANGFKYTDCDYITKDACLKGGKVINGIEHNYVNVMRDKYRTVFWRRSFERRSLIKTRGKTKLLNGYSIDHFSIDVNPCRVARTKPEVSVIIPTYNNGWFLYGRSFASLRRSSIFDKMEIIIVDDGSSDGFTPKMGLYLESLYPNVRTFHFPIGGSGTPSRPRNRGVELARGGYIVFHDPDNEAVCDGYAVMFREMLADKELDFVLGNTIKCDGKNTLLDYSGVLMKYTASDVLMHVKDALVKSSFMSANIQTMVIRKAFLVENRLTQVVGGTGEDSLFCQQMMAAAGKMKSIPVVAQIYYAERGDSIVNSIGESFFDKHLITERSRVKWLRSSGLFNEYLLKRFATYVIGWYFKKLGMVAPENREACCRKLMEILSLYGPGNPSGNQKIGKFIDAVSEGNFAALFGTTIPLPVVKSSGKRVEVLPPVAAFCLPLDKKFVRYSCPVDKKSMVYVSGAIECAGIQSDLEKSSIMCVTFEDGAKKPLSADGLSHSPKFGDYIYLTAGAGAARGFRQPIRVPENAVRLTLAFVRWTAKGELKLSDLKVVALES